MMVCFDQQHVVYTTLLGDQEHAIQPSLAIRMLSSCTLCKGTKTDMVT